MTSPKLIIALLAAIVLCLALVARSTDASLEVTLEYDTESFNNENEAAQEEVEVFSGHAETMFFGRARRWFRRAGDKIRRAARRAGASIKRAAKKAGSSIKKAGKKAGSGIKRAAKKAGRGIKNAARKAGKGLKKAGKAIKKFSKKAANKIKDFFVGSTPDIGVKKASSNGPQGAVPTSLKEAVTAYTPIVYMHPQEPWFATSGEKLTTTWNAVPEKELSNRDFTLNVNFGATKDFLSTAPVYTNVRLVGNQYWISYGFLYSYNDCGPHVRIYARASFIKLDKKIFPCPIGIHNGDIEHVTILVNKDSFKVEEVYHAYHAFGDTVKPNQVEWEGSRPVFYAAKGSHATYLTPGPQQYVILWNKQKKGAATFGVLEDYPTPTKAKGIRWAPQAHWLVNNGQIDESVTGTVSEADKKLAQFKGLLGPQIFAKPKHKKFVDNLRKVTSPIRKMKSSWDKLISEKINDLESELNPTPIRGFGTKDWFANAQTKADL